MDFRFPLVLLNFLKIELRKFQLKTHNALWKMHYLIFVIALIISLTRIPVVRSINWRAHRSSKSVLIITWIPVLVRLNANMTCRAETFDEKNQLRNKLDTFQGLESGTWNMTDITKNVFFKEIGVVCGNITDYVTIMDGSCTQPTCYCIYKKGSFVTP